MRKDGKYLYQDLPQIAQIASVYNNMKTISRVFQPPIMDVNFSVLTPGGFPVFFHTCFISDASWLKTVEVTMTLSCTVIHQSNVPLPSYRYLISVVSAVFSFFKLSYQRPLFLRYIFAKFR